MVKLVRNRERELQVQRENIKKALQIKEKYKGSVVWERVRCGKDSCHCRNGMGHGPYPYLHFYEQGKVKTKYLPKDVGVLVACPKTDLKEALCEVENELEILRTTEEGSNSHE